MDIGYRWTADQQQDLYAAAVALERDREFTSCRDADRPWGLAMLRVLLPRDFGPGFPSGLCELERSTTSISFHDLMTGDIVIFSDSDSDEVLLGCVLGYVNKHIIYVSPETDRAEIVELDHDLLGYRLSDCRRLLAMRSLAPPSSVTGDASDCGERMNNLKSPNQPDLQERLQRGLISREDLKARAEKCWQVSQGGASDGAAGDRRCPVCDSLLPANARVVYEQGFVACDYCIPYIEGTS